MDDGHGGCGSLPPFVVKTYEMVEDPITNPIVSWSPSNRRSFIIWNPLAFASDLLPKYFKHNNFSSFIRQLNTYGFRKVDPERWEFSNEDFVRGHPHLLKNIHRRKPVHSHSSQNLHPVTEPERKKLAGEIDRLKKDKQFLLTELQKHEQQRKEYEDEIQALKDRVRHAEERSHAAISSLARILQKPGLVELSSEIAINDKKRRSSRIGCLLDEMEVEENLMGMFYQSVAGDNHPRYLHGGSSHLEELEQLQSSLRLWEHIVRDANDKCTQPGASFDIDESKRCVESPDTSCMQPNFEVIPKSSGIDMKSEPSDVAQKEEPPKKTNGGVQPTGFNDTFWQQFFTENPGEEEDPHEVRSEAKEQGKCKLEDGGKFWCNMSNVNNLAEHMGHLTPAERT